MTSNIVPALYRVVARDAYLVTMPAHRHPVYCFLIRPTEPGRIIYFAQPHQKNSAWPLVRHALSIYSHAQIGEAHADVFMRLVWARTKVGRSQRRPTAAVIFDPKTCEKDI